MSKSKKGRKPSSKKSKATQKVNDDIMYGRKKEIAAILFFVFGIFLFFLALLKGVSFWNTMHTIYFGLFGVMSYLVPIIFMAIGVLLTSNKLKNLNKFKIIQLIIIILLFSSLIHILSYEAAPEIGFKLSSLGRELSYIYIDGTNTKGGGIIGSLLGWPLLALLGKPGATITIILSTIVFLLIVTGLTLLDIFRGIKKPVEKFETYYKEKSLENNDDEDNYILEPLNLPNHPVTSSPKIDISLSDGQRNKGKSFLDVIKDNLSKPKEFEENPMETFVKQESIAENDKYKNIKTIDIPLSNNTSFSNDSQQEYLENLPLDIGYSSNFEGDYVENISELSEIEQLIRKAVPVEATSIETCNVSDQNQFSNKLSDKDIFVNSILDKKSFISNLDDFENLNETESEFGLVHNTDTNKLNMNKPSIETERPVFTIPEFMEKNNKHNGKKNSTLKKQIDISMNDNPVKRNTVNHVSPTTEVANEYIKPPISLLNDVEKSVTGNITDELRQNAQTLVETLKSFGVETKVENISRGPTVTRYELRPKAGVKISRITNLSDDIALNLAAAGVRIEAPIPGKSAVGVEVPNKKTSMVGLKEIINSKEFQTSKSNLSFALGRDITGKAIVADISKMPHVLIAGATGSGKSVCINSIITSLVYKASPDEVRFLMIDPKIVELGVYNGIPHLLIPVVTDPKRAASALNWAVAEMQKRYNTFAKLQVRDLASYNRLAETNDEIEKMPQIVIIIDELSDLMMVASNEVENAIARLSQMARAAGMHLVIATQRPSVDVITGVIKANIPSRIAFSVSSSFDSRTILDSSGAEKLLGRGDMLFSPAGSPKPSRVQGCFVDDEEVERIVEFLKQKKDVEYDGDIIEEIESMAAEATSPAGNMVDETDELLDEAIECIFENNQASTSFLQRRLRVGYARAARMMDMIEDRGIVAPQEGSKPRDILMTKEQWIQKTMYE